MRSYDFHGLTVEVSLPIAAVHARFASLPPAGGAPDLRFEIGNGFGRPDGARTVYEPPVGEVVYDDARDLLYLEHGPRLRALADPGSGRVSFAVGDVEGEELWILSHPLLSVPMMELLKRRGLFGVHAAGAALDGKALVLAGTSGSGKSTLSLALARAGFDFLGDDTLFLARRAEGLRVLAFPDEIDLTEQTAGFFPELPETAARTTPGWRKRQLRAEEAFGTRIAWECEPAVVVFPRISGRPRSELRPVDAGEALLDLAPNVLLTQPGASQAHLDTLAELARAGRCYRLDTGTDLGEAAALLRGLLE